MTEPKPERPIPPPPLTNAQVESLRRIAENPQIKPSLRIAARRTLKAAIPVATITPSFTRVDQAHITRQINQSPKTRSD